MAKTLATRMAFGQEIIEIAKTNENFVVCNADTKTCGLEKFGKYFPEREFSFGIAEQNLVAASAGMAACGNKVFLATFAVFASMRACEQVRTFVCYPNLNVTVIGTHAGLQVGGDGATHAAIEDVSIMRSFRGAARRRRGGPGPGPCGGGFHRPPVRPSAPQPGCRPV